MGAAFSLEILTRGGHCAASHHGVAYDEHRFVFLGLGFLESVGYGGRVGAVYFNHVPVPGAVFCCVVLGVNGVNVGGELHLVAVIEHYEVREAQESGDTSGALAYLFLNASVGDKCVCLMGENLAEAGCDEALGYGRSHSHGVSLTERTAGVFHAAGRIELGMAGSHTAPLAEFLKLVNGVMALQGENTVEHRRHVTGIKEETVAREPCGIVGVCYQKAGIKHVDEVSSTHGAARMT